MAKDFPSRSEIDGIDYPTLAARLDAIDAKIARVQPPYDLSDEPPVHFDPPLWKSISTMLSTTHSPGLKAPSFTKVADNGSGSTGVYAQGFGSAAETELTFDVQMPHTWQAGTGLNPTLHWFHKHATPGSWNVRWGLEYLWVTDGAALPATTTTIYADVAHGPAGEGQEANFPAIEVNGESIESVVLCRLFRETAGDDFPADAYGVALELHYLSNVWGTYEEHPH